MLISDIKDITKVLLKEKEEEKHLFHVIAKMRLGGRRKK
jgi:hypothetical protein